MRFLTGNSFPLNLIVRPVRIYPKTLEQYRAALRRGEWVSFWGHTNTLHAVRQAVEFDLTPRESRAVISLDAEGYPMLYGESYRECWILAPQYVSARRPAIGAEVELSGIQSWRALQILWEEETCSG